MFTAQKTNIDSRYKKTKHIIIKSLYHRSAQNLTHRYYHKICLGRQIVYAKIIFRIQLYVIEFKFNTPNPFTVAVYI